MSYSARPALLLGSIIHQKCDFGAYLGASRIGGRASPGAPKRTRHRAIPTALSRPAATPPDLK